MIGLFFGLKIATFLFFLGAMIMGYLIGLRVLSCEHEVLSFTIANGLVDLSLCIVVFYFFPATTRRLPVYILSLNDFFETPILLGLVMALAAVEFGHLGSRSLLPTFGGTLLMAFIWTNMFIFVDFQIKLNEEILIGLLQLLNVGLGVFEQVDLLFLELIQLSLESVCIEFELILYLHMDVYTPILFLIYVSPLCSSCYSFEYSSSRERCLMNSRRMH